MMVRGGSTAQSAVAKSAVRRRRNGAIPFGTPRTVHARRRATAAFEERLQSGKDQPLMPGRLSSRLACLSARFSFRLLPAFLLFDFLGDLSAIRSRVTRRGRVRGANS